MTYYRLSRFQMERFTQRGSSGISLPETFMEAHLTQVLTNAQNSIASPPCPDIRQPGGYGFLF